jgi:hypothetical protein
MRRLIGVIAVLALTMAATPALAGGGQSGVKEARQGTAKFHKVSHAEASGYGSTIDVLGCFENPAGGMGVHYLNPGLLDATVAADEPEALVYEMREDGQLKLVGLEYLVPEELVDPSSPPQLFGHHFHPHPVLPFWIMHAWVWRPNPSGIFMDWNPNVAPCPDGVPVFGG